MSIGKRILQEEKKKFGERIRSLRTGKGMSQSMLAAKCNLEKTTISRIENGRTNVTLKTILNLSNSLEVDLSSLFDYNG